MNNRTGTALSRQFLLTAMLGVEMLGLTYNEFGGYYEGDAWAARGDEIGRQERQEEREFDAMERMSKLYAEMAKEFADNGKTRRWNSLMMRAEGVRGWWHANP